MGGRWPGVLLCACVKIICALSLRLVQFALFSIEGLFRGGGLLGWGGTGVVCGWLWEGEDWKNLHFMVLLWSCPNIVLHLLPSARTTYEAIRQAYLDGTDTESEPFEDPIKTESPLTVAPPTSLPETVPPAMSHGLSASMVEVGTSELVEDEEEDDDEDDDEIEESLDSDRVEDPGMGVESRGLDDESHGLDDESNGLDDEGHSVESDGLDLEEEEEAVPRGQQQTVSVVGTTVSAPLGLGYGALRRRELALEEVQMQGGLIRDHAVLLKELSPALFERYDRDIGELFTRSGQLGMRFSPRDPSPSCRPTKVEVPKELPKVSMVNTSLKKLKHHLTGFDVVVKERTTATAITKGS
ncbi:hypothetical protein Tco_0533603 [Tanacetum coccineum]